MNSHQPKRKPDFDFLTNSAAFDGVTLSSNDSGVACARCPGSLEIAHIEGFKIAACRDCHGLLIEARLLAKIISLGRANYDGPEVAAIPLNPDELRQATDCVVCGSKMDTHSYCGPGSVVIDSCDRCGLIWLDGRELKRIFEAPGKRELLATGLTNFDQDNCQPDRLPANGNATSLEDDGVNAALIWMNL